MDDERCSRERGRRMTDRRRRQAEFGISLWFHEAKHWIFLFLTTMTIVSGHQTRAATGVLHVRTVNTQTRSEDNSITIRMLYWKVRKIASCFYCFYEIFSCILEYGRNVRFCTTRRREGLTVHDEEYLLVVSTVAGGGFGYTTTQQCWLSCAGSETQQSLENWCCSCHYIFDEVKVDLLVCNSCDVAQRCARSSRQGSGFERCRCRWC